MKTKFYIDFVHEKVNGSINCYYQLVRRADEAILYANPDLNNIFLFCFHAGINKEQVVLF